LNEGAAMARKTAVCSDQQVEIIQQNEKLVVSSLEVARHFSKEHKNVVRAIRNLDCSEEF